MIIDIFAHNISRRVGKIINREKYLGEGPDKEFNYSVQNADPEVRLELMDKYSINIHALSQTTPVLLGFNSSDAADICRLSNDDNFILCKAYPKRFVNICIFSLLDVSMAMKELDRSINELDCRGVTIATNQDGKGLDSPEYFPFYEKVVQHDLPIFLQPTHWKSYPLVDMDNGYYMMSVFGWIFDTTQAIWRLIFGGVLDRFPTLKIVTHHCAALLPYYFKRAEGTTIIQPRLRKRIKMDLSEYWKRIYGDSIVGGQISALKCGYEFLGPERMMYGSDYPFGPGGGEGTIREVLNMVRKLDISPENLQKILGDNAQSILKIR